ncbi:hypothetical protein [Chitinolyticbacter albus]|uniref:hypothetical protein n=1 Tax=Chitinolyticbacter albus TaxID=2961951 RepID=UPI00210BBD58|nr:hypothetical protein [Chitinolyticbacter albus]
MIDETADIKRAVASILMSKTFDNGVVVRDCRVEGKTRRSKLVPGFPVRAGA